jgi:hypothetical protein
VFKTTYLDGRSWGFVIGFSFVPALFDEIVKSIYRATGFGARAKARRTGYAGGDISIRVDDKKEATAPNGDKQPLVGGAIELQVR